MSDQTDNSSVQPVGIKKNTNMQEVDSQQTSIQDKRTKFCPDCGSEISSKAEICPKCGVRQPITSQPIVGKSPALAAILTLCILPIGYLYIGRLKRGIVVTIMALILGVLTAGIAGFIILAIAIYDTYKLARNEPAPFDILNRWNLG